MTIKRVWHVGDSTTYAGVGQLHSFPRRAFEQWLRTRGYYGWDTIGTQTDGDWNTYPTPPFTSYIPFSSPRAGPMAAWRHDGHSGQSISYINSNFASWASTIGLLDTDIVYVGIGTNDAGADSGSVMLASMDTLTTTMSGVTGAELVICNIPPNLNSPRDVNCADFNAGLPAQIEALGGQFSFLNRCGSLDTATDLQSDGTHPNASGYTKMGEATAADFAVRANLPRGKAWPRRPTPQARTYALQLGTSSYVQIPYVSALHVGSQAFWIALWFMPLAAESASTKVIFQLTGSDYTAGLTLFQSGAAVDALYKSGDAYVGPTTGVVRSRWNRLVMAADGAGRIQAWVNGRLYRETTQPAYTIAGGDYVRIGEGNLTSTAPGFYSDMSIGIGDFPTPEDVRADYLDGTAMPGAVVRYRLSEGTGVSVADALGVGSAGVVTNGTWVTSPLPPPGSR
jgi:hypothetical protein